MHVSTNDRSVERAQPLAGGRTCIARPRVPRRLRRPLPLSPVSSRCRIAIDVKGAANAAQNTGKLAILVLGDFEHDVLDFSDDDSTPAQITSANALATTLAAEFPSIKRLVGHRDIKPDTECPGGELYKRLSDIRNGTGLSA